MPVTVIKFFNVMRILEQVTNETAGPNLTRNISKRVSPREVRTFGVKTTISQYWGSRSQTPQNWPE